MQDFNPRLPRGKRHHILKHRGHFLFISIHASREGSDSVFKEAMELIENFNPRFPRGKRLKTDWIDQQNDLFQSTLPAGEATTWPRRNIPSLTGFQSTLPAGEATCTFPLCPDSHHISIHASRGGSDVKSPPPPEPTPISIHASRGGSDILKESRCRTFS